MGYLPEMWHDFGVAVAGLTFLLKAGGGLYWMIPAVLAGLVGGVINAWLFLVRVPPAIDEQDINVISR